ncbi:GNAT family N-acetyltransferase [Neorhizobium galegae]|uniref:GNAT family N-acetyltransferase n=1 Tax=Neorhizobium galegae TaxID=399 RepID=UPI001288276E|nr:GNAT family N-acetyltransferase [Neorhizobium galegae]KAA9386831.1 GNAT family N-acetyltransferase [Neorhizobium galegae]MCM2501818.1 GNAT family N-acetyltransferase [Neorhizobium galegae]
MRRNFTYAELTNGVRTLSDPAIQWWNDRFADFNFTPKDVCDYLTWGMPGDRDNFLERIDISSHRTSVEVKGYDDQGEVFWAGRTIQFRPLEFNLDVLKIREDYQSLGYGKLLLGNSYRFAKLLGFKRLTLTAVGIGSYAWSKAGFLESVREFMMGVRSV